MQHKYSTKKGQQWDMAHKGYLSFFADPSPHLDPLLFNLTTQHTPSPPPPPHTHTSTTYIHLHACTHFCQTSLQIMLSLY